MYIICSRCYKGRSEAFSVNKLLHCVFYLLTQIIIFATSNKLLLKIIVPVMSVLTIPAIIFIRKLSVSRDGEWSEVYHVCYNNMKYECKLKNEIFSIVCLVIQFRWCFIGNLCHDQSFFRYFSAYHFTDKLSACLLALIVSFFFSLDSWPFLFSFKADKYTREV